MNKTEVHKIVGKVFLYVDSYDKELGAMYARFGAYDEGWYFFKVCDDKAKQELDCGEVRVTHGDVIGARITMIQTNRNNVLSVFGFIDEVFQWRL